MHYLNNKFSKTSYLIFHIIIEIVLFFITHKNAYDSLLSLKPEESYLSLNDFETNMLNIDHTKEYVWEYFNEKIFDSLNPWCLHSTIDKWKKHRGDKPYHLRIVKLDEYVYLILEAE